jgi:sugar (pentulose or hexulose) kinase
MSSQRYVLAVDAGTSMMKAAVFDRDGNQVAFAEKPMTVLHPFEGACEMDMDAVWAAFCEVSRKLASEVPEAWHALAGVAITGQGDGLWPLDKNGKPLSHAILWNDSRCKDASFTHSPEIVRFSQDNHCSQLFSAASPVLLRWIKDNQPDRFAKLGHALHCKDWLVFQLTGTVMTDRSDASTSLYNVLGNRYEFELLDLLGLPRSTGDLFPEVYSSMTLVGQTTPEGERSSSIPANIPVMAGSIDPAAAAFGAGARQPGDAITILGTTFTNQVILDPEMVDHTDTAGSILYHIYPERYIRVMSPSNGGGVLTWVRDQLRPDLKFTVVEAEISKIPAGADGLFFLPYLNSERAPFRDARSTGSFHGLTVNHQIWHLFRAAYEGLVYSIRDCYTHLPPDESPVRLCGGASKSALVCQMVANVLNRPTLRIPRKEFGLIGISSALWEALGHPVTIEDVTVGTNEKFTPQPEAVAVYEQGFKIYQQLRECQKDFWQARNGIIEST